MYASGLIALAASIVSVSAGAIQGFNYGATHTDQSPMTESDFQSLFQAAQKLAGTNGAFASARLYTSIQAGTTNSPSSAFQAAVQTKTRLLLGMWASGGDTVFSNELAAVENAIHTYGSSFTDLVDGISVGSEDLYRVTPTSISNDPTSVGASPDTIIGYIKQLRGKLSGTGLSGAPVGHVDTWTAWVNSSNSDVVSACDWIGMDAYPYFQTQMSNSIEDGPGLFNTAYEETKANALGKPVWVTETGWPISGPKKNQATAGTTEAEEYWQKVGCGMLFGEINTYWYTLNDAAPTTPSPSFGLLPAGLANTPAYDLSCSPQAKASASSAATKSYNTASAKASGSAAASSAGSETNGSPAVTSAPSGSGSGSGSNGTASTFLASTALPTPGAGPSGTGSSSPVHTGAAAVVNAGSVAGVLGAVLAVVAAL